MEFYTCKRLRMLLLIKKCLNLNKYNNLGYLYNICYRNVSLRYTKDWQQVYACIIHPPLPLLFKKCDLPNTDTTLKNFFKFSNFFFWTTPIPHKQLRFFTIFYDFKQNALITFTIFYDNF